MVILQSSYKNTVELVIISDCLFKGLIDQVIYTFVSKVKKYQCYKVVVLIEHC